MEQILGFLGPILEVAAGKNGVVLQVLTWLVASSAIVKALESFAKVVVKVIPGKKDDEWLGKVLNSDAYKWVNKAFALLLNLKLPEPKEDDKKPS